MTTKLILLSQPIHHSVAESELLTSPEAEALLPRREVAIGGRPEAEEAVEPAIGLAFARSLSAPLFVHS